MANDFTINNLLTINEYAPLIHKYSFNINDNDKKRKAESETIVRIVKLHNLANSCFPDLPLILSHSKADIFSFIENVISSQGCFRKLHIDVYSEDSNIIRSIRIPKCNCLDNGNEYIRIKELHTEPNYSNEAKKLYQMDKESITIYPLISIDALTILSRSLLVRDVSTKKVSKVEISYLLNKDEDSLLIPYSSNKYIKIENTFRDYYISITSDFNNQLRLTYKLKNKNSTIDYISIVFAAKLIEENRNNSVIYSVILKDFKNSVHYVRKGATEDLIETFITVIGGVMISEVSFSDHFNLLLRVGEYLDDFKKEYKNMAIVENFKNFDSFCKANNLRNYLTYKELYDEEIISQVAKSFHYDPRSTDIAKNLFSDKMFLVFIPLEQQDIFNQFINKIINKRDIGCKVELYHELNNFYHQGLKIFNSIPKTHEAYDYTDMTIINKDDQDLWKYDLIPSNLHFKGTILSFLMTKPSADISDCMNCLLKVFKGITIRNIIPFDWNKIQENNGKSFSELFYNNCKNRPYGNQWLSYLGTKESYIFVYELPENVEDQFAVMRNRIIQARKDSQRQWTRNIAHGPSSIEELRKNKQYIDELGYSEYFY